MLSANGWMANSVSDEGKTKETEVCAQPLPNGDLIGNGFWPPLPMKAFTSVTEAGTRTLSPLPKGFLARFRCDVLY